MSLPWQEWIHLLFMWMSHVFQETLHHNLALVNGHLECSWSSCKRDGGTGIHYQGGEQKKRKKFFNQQVWSLTSGLTTPCPNEDMLSSPFLDTLLMKTGSMFYIRIGFGGSIAGETSSVAAFTDSFAGNIWYLLSVKRKNAQTWSARKQINTSELYNCCSQPSAPHQDTVLSSGRYSPTSVSRGCVWMMSWNCSSQQTSL